MWHVQMRFTISMHEIEPKALKKEYVKVVFSSELLFPPRPPPKETVAHQFSFAHCFASA